MSYYEVKAKFGHVGRDSYVIKSVFLEADSKKEAAKKARWFPRVKHHLKSAIVEVSQIDWDRYKEGKWEARMDAYFHVHSPREQSALVELDPSDIKRVDYDESTSRRRIRRSIIAEFIKEMQYSM